ncbi:MAG: SDR family oxidoreductase [Candidatus Moranbacteria bacterium]|nr:SDR family oxidoreductase [Candidatus Moranbacteria bacterium]
MNDLKNKRVLVIGVGIKPVQHVFRDIRTGKPTHSPIFDGDTEYKANIGAAIALECAKAGAVVHMVSHSEDKLQIVQRWIRRGIPGSVIEYSVVDLGGQSDLEHLAKELPNDLPLYWVQSLGLGAGTVEIKDDNPYIPIEEIPTEFIDAEFSVTKSTIQLLQALLPRFRKQEETRICIISSMSAIRSVVPASIHHAGKGALDRFANAAMLELEPEEIYVTTIRPGAIDTGLYDSQPVQESIHKICRGYGRSNTGYAPPSSVAEAVVLALTSEAHITSLNLVARGQFPHEGS